MKFITTVLSFLSLTLCFGQSLPFDFSNSNQSFIGFSGSNFSFNTDPTNGANPVAQFFNDGSSTWQGFTVNLADSIDLGFQNTLSLNFYGIDTNTHNIVMKLENGVNANVQVTVIVPSGGGWTNNIIFDFSNAVYSSNGTPINATGTYSKLTLFIDGGAAISGTYLIDEISDGTTPTNPNVLDVIYSNLVWQDEFNTPGSVNSLNWHHQTQVIIPGVGWANGEEQHYTSRIENSFVDNSGYLQIVAKNETYTTQGLTKNYTSARLNSKFAFTYGRVDVRAKLPIEAGTWPAIWMLGKNINEDGGYWDANFGTTPWPTCGELDIMEHGIFPAQSIDYINSAIHTNCCHGGNPNQGGTLASDLANNFHVYSINWSPNQITFLLDDVGFYTYNPALKNLDNWPFFEDQFILLNVAMGGIAGAVDPSFSNTSMVVDYVRVYQNSTATIDEQANLENSLQIYPNPAKDWLFVKAEQTPTSLIISDLFGKQIRKEVGETERIDISDLASGVYLLEVYSNNQRVVRKIIVE
jgi:beta-glucanase (GH16 family)